MRAREMKDLIWWANVWFAEPELGKAPQPVTTIEERYKWSTENIRKLQSRVKKLLNFQHHYATSNIINYLYPSWVTNPIRPVHSCVKTFPLSFENYYQNRQLPTPKMHYMARHFSQQFAGNGFTRLCIHRGCTVPLDITNTTIKKFWISERSECG